MWAKGFLFFLFKCVFFPSSIVFFLTFCRLWIFFDFRCMIKNMKKKAACRGSKNSSTWDRKHDLKHANISSLRSGLGVSHWNNADTATVAKVLGKKWEKNIHTMPPELFPPILPDGSSSGEGNSSVVGHFLPDPRKFFYTFDAGNRIFLRCQSLPQEIFSFFSDKNFKKLFFFEKVPCHWIIPKPQWE